MQADGEDFATFLKRREAISVDYINGRAKGLLEVSTDRDPATFFPPNGGHVVGAARVNEANTKGAASFGMGSKGSFEILQFGFGDDLGFWTGFQHANVVIAGKDQPVAMSLRVTEVFRCEGGAWKLVHRHADMPDGK
jgi:ketosteroid isomerase-like protein